MTRGSIFGDQPSSLLRDQIDAVFERARSDADFARLLEEKPQAAVESLGFDGPTAREIAGSLGFLASGCDDTCIQNTNADCKYDTCRVTDACGWTVCDTTNKGSFLPAHWSNEARVKLDEVLERVRTDDGLRKELIESPRETLQGLGFDVFLAGRVAVELGLELAYHEEGTKGCKENTCQADTQQDCGHDTCRTTNPCGWTVCGEKTYYAPGELGGIRRDPLESLTLERVSAAEFLSILSSGTFAEVTLSDAFAAIQSEKKKRELEEPPKSAFGVGTREEDLDRLADAVAERLKDLR